MRLQLMLLTVSALLLAAEASAGDICSSRFGNLYYPDDIVEFDLGFAGARWRISDVDERELAVGVAARGRVSVSHETVGRRCGAFVISATDGSVTNRLRFAFLTSRDVRPAPWVGTGLHAGRWYGDDIAFLDLVAAAGIGMIRMCTQWDYMEPAKGRYRTRPATDRLIDRANELGIRVNWHFFRKNPVYANPLDPQAFAAFCGWVADRYKGKIDLYEIWNEPQNFDFFEHYRKVYDYGCNYSDRRWMRHFVELTRAADEELSKRPGLTVCVGAADWWQVLDGLLESGLARAHNVVTIHPYDHTRPFPETAPFFADGFGACRDKMASWGGAKRIGITEAGWTTYDASTNATHAFVGNYPPVTFAEQAQYLVRMFLIARQSEIEFVCQYDFRDDGPRRNYTEHNFGLLDYQSNPKPSFAAVAFMTRLLGAAVPAGAESTDPKLYRVYRFRREDGKSVLATWSVRQPCAIPFAEKSAAVYDLFGNRIALPITGDRLFLTERPIYIETAR